MNNTITQNYINSIKQRFGIIGNSDSIFGAISNLIEVAPTNLAVLITGETGTGKEVFANAVHNLSQRNNKPFLSVNCGAIPETLLESELFGHEKGAFTSAVDQRIGFFEAADKGTIFLDEIGEMPIQTQVKLLRILESGEFSRLGSSKILKVDIRIIAATNRNLTEEISAKKFRSDLYYRLNQVNITLPSLREHIHDIPLYFDHFAKIICKRNNIEYQGVSDDAITILKAQYWHGNIREFKNFVDKIITLEKGRYVDTYIVNKYIPQSLPGNAFEIIESSNALIPIRRETNIINNETIVFQTLLGLKNDVMELKQMVSGLGLAFDRMDNEMNFIKDSLVLQQSDNQQFFDSTPSLKEMEKELIIRYMKKFSDNKRLVAGVLGISERTLYRKIEEYELIFND